MAVIEKFEALSFKVGYSAAIDEEPSEFYEAQVPGAVQLDWERAKRPGPDSAYWKGENFRDYAFAESSYWHYISEFTVRGDQFSVPVLFFKSIDYACSIQINNKEIYRHEGMFTPIYLELGEYRGKLCRLSVIIFPAPKRPDGDYAPGNSCKPAVSYGWDFHPRLIPLGICDECGLKHLPKNHIKREKISVSSKLSDDYKTAYIYVRAELANSDLIYENCEITLTVISPRGEKFTDSLRSDTSLDKNSIDFSIKIDDPLLWWCAGEGEQNLYTIALELVKDGDIIDKYITRTGLRRIRLVANEDTWVRKSFPATQCVFPITIELNGRRIFAKGSNWVPPDIFPGTLTQETYNSLLTLCRGAHMNLIRCWGGGPVNKDGFYEICDEMGLMIWQEFPLSCNFYSESDDYLALLNRESRSVIMRLRRHPCISVWCGGNELFFPASQMTNQSPALRLLDKNCYELCPEIPYLPTSPLYGMGHGHYILFDDDSNGETVTAFVESNMTAYTEFGCSGPSPVDYLKTFMTQEEFENFDTAEVWKSHHAREAWSRRQTWFRICDVERFYGPQTDFEKLIELGGLLQAQGYKHLFEEARRQWPRCSMALNWCFNEPWATAANNSIINWPCNPKPAYYAVKESLRPQMVSLRFLKLLWNRDEIMRVDIFVLNDSNEILRGGDIEIYIFDLQEEKIIQVLSFGDIESRAASRINQAALPLNGYAGDTVRIGARIKDRPLLSSVYELSLRG